MDIQAGLLSILLLPLVLQGLLAFFRLPKILYLLPGLVSLLGILWLVFVAPEANRFAENEWLRVGSDSIWKISLSLQFENALFASLASVFSLLIQLYSLSYLRPTDSHKYFHFLIRVFQTAMCWLFLSGNLVSLFLAWEWIGISSYLLVQFWYGEENPVRSGLRVLLINKLGDVFLLLGLGALVSFGLPQAVFTHGGFPAGAEVFFHSKTGSLLVSFLVLAALVKSAQFPFSVWLKEAMQGPTSVSALLHSATMVLAGIWLLTRLEPVFSIPLHSGILMVGLLTLALSSIGAVYSMRIKELLAFSTVAQLSIMLIAIGLGKPQLALFHGFTHAFFKAALFLMAGWLMHEAEHRNPEAESQDIRFWRGVLAHSPWKWPFLFCLAALSGLPFTSGFISKESLLPEIWGGNPSSIDWLVYGLLQIGVVLTALYSFRLFFWTHSTKHAQPAPASPSIYMAIPIVFLSLGSGFWLVGLNPLSSQGWVQAILRFEGSMLHPDIWAVTVGIILAWRWERKLGVEWPVQSEVLSDIFRWSFFPTLASRLGQLSLRFSRSFLWWEEKAMDLPPRRLADAFLVGGYFSGFVDRWILDPLLESVVYLIHSVGELIRETTRKYPQYVVWFAMTFLFVLIYLVYRT